MNANQTFQFRLVSPEAEVMNAPAVQVTVPGAAGEFGVRVGHMPLISALKPGVVHIVTDDGAAPTRFFIAGGFANVNAAECSVIAESVTDVLALDPQVIQADIDALTARLAADLDDQTAATLQAELTLAQARLAAARG